MEIIVSTRSGLVNMQRDNLPTLSGLWSMEHLKAGHTLGHERPGQEVVKELTQITAPVVTMATRLYSPRFLRRFSNEQTQIFMPIARRNVSGLARGRIPRFISSFPRTFIRHWPAMLRW